MGFTKSGLVYFFDERTAVISEAHQSEANLLILGFILDFEKSYKYENAVLQKNVPYVPPYLSAIPQSLQEEIRRKMTAKLTELGEYSPEKVEDMMRFKIYDLKEMIDIKDYVKWQMKKFIGTLQRSWRQTGGRKGEVPCCGICGILNNAFRAWERNRNRY